MLSRNSVQDSPALRGQDAGVQLQTVSLLVLLDPLLLLQLLEAPSDDFGGSVLVYLSLAVVSVSSSVDVGKQSDSGVGSEVDFAGKRCDSDIDPVLVGGCEFLP